MADAEGVAATPRGTAAFDRVAQAVHWFVVVLVVCVVVLGWTIEGAPRNSSKRDFLILVREPVGLTIFAAMVFRAVWRWRHPPPPLPPVRAILEIGLARFTHLALYLLLFIMPLAGYLSVAAVGDAVGDRSQSRRAIPLYLFIALHVAGALFHGAIRRDGVIECMLPMRRSA